MLNNIKLVFSSKYSYLNFKHLKVVVPISPDENNEISKENLPDYLPEDYYENSSSVADNAVCKQSSQVENAQQEGSILNSALNFVRSSFYW